MRIFFDTEFHEYKKKGADTIELISIGMVDEKGNQLYLISNEFDVRAAWNNQWLRDNVCKKLDSSITSLGTFKKYIDKEGVDRNMMQKLIIQFCGKQPEFWAYFASYDWVVFCWIFGGLMKLPDNFPQYIMDLQQVINIFKINKQQFLSQVPKTNLHNALEDAKWNKKVWEWIDNLK